MPRTPSSAGYEELRTGKDEGGTHSHITTNRETSRVPLQDRGWIQIVMMVVVSVVFFGIGVGVDRRYSRIEKKLGLLVPPGSTKETWYLNMTFSMKPTPESEDAWASLMPHGLRTSYYDLHYQLARAAGAPPDSYLEQKASHTHVETAHQKHCFDYLRRAIMCAADTNLEYVDPVTDDTTGWGSERVCRSFEDVKEWTERWANGTDEGIA